MSGALKEHTDLRSYLNLQVYILCKIAMPSLTEINQRAVSKISSCRVITTSRWGVKQLGNSFASIFLLFSYRSSRGQCSQLSGKIPSPRSLMTLLIRKPTGPNLVNAHKNRNLILFWLYWQTVLIQNFWGEIRCIMGDVQVVYYTSFTSSAFNFSYCACVSLH